MNSDYLALYDNPLKYADELDQNLSDCKNHFLNSFGKNNSEIISVCAPG